MITNNKDEYDNLIDYFEANILFLNEFKWIYDFQMTELFCHSLFSKQFPTDVITLFFLTITSYVLTNNKKKFKTVD